MIWPVAATASSERMVPGHPRLQYRPGQEREGAGEARVTWMKVGSGFLPLLSVGGHLRVVSCLVLCRVCACVRVRGRECACTRVAPLYARNRPKPNGLPRASRRVGRGRSQSGHGWVELSLC